MSELVFDWDDQKARVNERKHGVSFEEAQTVFYDENARLRYDTAHSLDEERYILLGVSNMLRLLVVCHVYREEKEVIRIISARKATKQEGKQYRGFYLWKMSTISLTQFRIHTSRNWKNKWRFDLKRTWWIISKGYLKKWEFHIKAS